MIDLKPCPFCGGEARMESVDLGVFWVECKNCYAETICADTEDEAAAAWNRRVTDEMEDDLK